MHIIKRFFIWLFKLTLKQEEEVVVEQVEHDPWKELTLPISERTIPINIGEAAKVLQSLEVQVDRCFDKLEPVYQGLDDEERKIVTESLKNICKLFYKKIQIKEVVDNK